MARCRPFRSLVDEAAPAGDASDTTAHQAGTTPTAVACAATCRTILTFVLRHAGPRHASASLRRAGADHAPAGVRRRRDLRAPPRPCERAVDPTRGWWDAQAGQAADRQRAAALAFDWIGADGSLDAPDRPRRPGRCAPPRCSTISASTAPHAFVGASYGAMVGLHFASRHPPRVRPAGRDQRHAPHASVSPAPSARCSAGGAAGRSCRATASTGVALARQLAMTELPHARGIRRTLRRSAAWLTAACTCAAEHYLDACGAAAYARAHAAAAFLRLSESIDLQHVDPGSITHPATWWRSKMTAWCRWPTPTRSRRRLRGETRLRVLRVALRPRRVPEGARTVARRAARSARVGGGGMSTPRDRSAAPPSAVRAGIDRDTAFGAVTPPIVLSTNFSFAGFDQKRAYDYTPQRQPDARPAGRGAGRTRRRLRAAWSRPPACRAITLVAARARASRAAAWSCRTIATAAAGACSTRSPTKRHVRAGHGRPHRSREALDAALAERRDVVWIETPSNPLLRITDLAATIAAAHQAGALAVVDNTFLSPALQQPIALRRRHRGALHDQVHQRPQRRGRRRGRSPATPPCTNSWPGGPMRSASPAPVRQLPHPARPAHACPRGSACTRRMPALVADCLAAHPAVAAVHYPGLAARIPATRSPRASRPASAG